jgi:flavoprotein
MVGRVRVLGIHPPVEGKEGLQTCRVGQSGKEVVPAYVLPAGLGDGDVYQVTSPSQGTDPKQAGQVVVETGFSVLEPAQARPEAFRLARTA